MVMLKKFLATFVSIIMLFASMSTCLTGIVYATNFPAVHVAFTADTSDGKQISVNNKKLIYQNGDDQYTISIVKIESEEREVTQAITYREQDHDFAATNLEDYDQMYFRVDANNDREDDIALDYAGHPLVMNQGHSAQSLDEILGDETQNDCINIYIRLNGENNQGNNKMLEFSNATFNSAENSADYTIQENETNKVVSVQVGARSGDEEPYQFVPIVLNGEHTNPEANVETEDFAGYYLKINNPDNADIDILIDGNRFQPDDGGWYPLAGRTQNHCFIEIVTHSEDHNPGNNNENGTLEFELGEGDSYLNNVITYSNGYTLTVTVGENPAVFQENNNRNNVEIRDLAQGTNVTYTLGLPNTYQEGDTIPTILFNGAREVFVKNEQTGIYSFTQAIGHINVIPVVLDFGDNGNDNPPPPGPGQNIGDMYFQVDFGTATWTVRGKTATATVDGKVLNNGVVELKGDEIIHLEGFNSAIMEATITVIEDGKDLDECYSTKLNVNENNNTSISDIRADGIGDDLVLLFRVGRKTRDNPEFEPLPEVNATTNITVSSSDAEHLGSFKDARITLNRFPIEIPFDNVQNSVNFENFEYNYNSEENEGKVTLRFSSLFIFKYVGTITINNVPYNVSDYIDYTDRMNFLEHYAYQEVGFDILVDKADNYNIVLDIEGLEGEYQWIGNFLWTDNEEEQYDRDEHGDIIYDEHGNPRVNDNYVDHSILELVKIEYEIKENGVDVLHTVTENFDEDPCIEYDGLGSLTVPEGSKCTMRIIPDYGYQVTSFGINGQAIETGENISEFTFPIHKGNFHLGAEVTKVEDIVTTQTDAISSGNIEINQNEIDSGSVELTVKNAEGLTDEQIAGFAATKEGYNISNYLDVNLNKILYKGNAEDVWREELKDLNNPATVRLQVAEGINGDEIVILHEKHDGSFEIIPTVYDPETNTITFTTKSFSNYAIASHTHTQAEAVKENEIAATCSKEGSYDEVIYCNTCHEELSRTPKKIEKLSHTPVIIENASVKKATVTQDGLITLSTVTKCSVCNEEIGGAGETKTIFHPETFTLSKTIFTYNKKVQKPIIIIKDSAGNIIDSSNYKVTYSNKNSKNIGEYKITVTFIGDYYEGTKTIKYYIAQKETSISKLTAAKKKFTVTWKKQTYETTGYEIQYSTSKDFTTGNKTISIASNKTTSRAVTKLKAKKKYYVRIRTYKKVGKNKIYSDWSKSKSVTTKK